MTAAKRYKTKRPDRIINSDGIGKATDEAVYHALRPLDAVAVEMERQWGVDRLVELVAPETAARFGKVKARLDSAIDENDPEQVAKWAAMMIKGWNALSSEAEAAGASGVGKGLRIIRHDDGRAFGIAVDQATATAAVRSGDYPNVSIWSLDEVVRVLASEEMRLANSVKDTFPGAVVARVGKVPSDDLPF